MGKILLLAIAVWLLITVIKRYRNNVDVSQRTQGPRAEDMVRCNHCGVHLPKSDSIFIKNQYYCCEEHSKQPT